MKTLVLSVCLMLSAACVRELPVDANDAGDPKAQTAPVNEGSGVLLADFNPDSVAPAAAPAAGGHEHHQHGAAPADPAQPVAYTCSHHPEVVSDKPGKCPKCGMDLVPKKPAASPPSAAPNPHEGH